jgi:hypothetical protein
MKWAYLLVFNDQAADRDSITEFLDREAMILNWFACFPSAVFLVSGSSAKTISERIRAKFPGLRFFITEIPDDRNGWMPRKAWAFINNPKSANEE